MKNLITVFFIFSLVAVCSGERGQEFVGKKFTDYWKAFPYDTRFDHGSGVLNLKGSTKISSSNEEVIFTTYMVLKDGRFLTLLTKLTDSSNIHSPEIIIDAITEKMPKGATSCFCYYKKNNPNKAYYRSIIAIVKKEDVEVYTDIKKTWKINTKLNRFEEIPVKDIVCVNDGYGV